MLAEHIKNAAIFHKNIFDILVEGGLAVHFFPTLYAFPFLANKLICERLSIVLLNKLNPRNRFKFDKFPAYYSWCRGPTRKMFKRFEMLGYEIIEYKGFYGHDGYYKKIPLIKDLHKYFSKFLLQHPNPYLTSYAFVILMKPKNICTKT